MPHPDPVTELFGEPSHYHFIPGIGHVTARDRSYEVRNHIAGSIGAPEHSDFTVANHAESVRVTFEDGTEADLFSTSNAGFSGIVGYFVNGDHRAHRSLGEVAEWVVSR